jgi:hypothetical protein
MPKGALGMDHRAIVWCHALLHVVRKVIWVLAVSEEEAVAKRLDQVQRVLGQNASTYQEDVQGLDGKLGVSCGHFSLSLCCGSFFVN